MDVFAEANAVDCQSCTQPFTCASIDQQWSTDALHRRLKLGSNLNVSGMVSSLDDHLNFPTKKSVRDPLSHRIIEKKRRDRMNNCLANLSSLLPSSYLKKSRGRVEKTEIIEMAIMHLKNLQTQHNRNQKTDNSNDSSNDSDLNEASMDSFCLGYQECMSQVMHFLVEADEFYARDNLCSQLLNHLRKHSENIRKHYNTHKNFTIENKNIKIKKEIKHTIDTTKVQNEKSIEMRENKNQKSPKTNSPNSNNNKIATGVVIKPDNKNDEIYKYKTRIKHRFNADLQLQRPIKNEPSQIDGLITTAIKTINPLTSILSPPPPSTVPMFVLHPRGSFYVPLVIDTHVVSPFFEPFKESLPILHPINITVCFSPHPGELESHEIRWMRPWEITDPDSFSKKYVQNNGKEHEAIISAMQLKTND